MINDSRKGSMIKSNDLFVKCQHIIKTSITTRFYTINQILGKKIRSPSIPDGNATATILNPTKHL